jgi:hypothetical protein
MLLVVVVSVTHLIQECITLERNGDYAVISSGVLNIQSQLARIPVGR